MKNDIGFFERVSEAIKPEVENFVNATNSALAAAGDLINNASTATAAQYESFGRQMTEIASDYARGLLDISNGFGNSAESAAIDEISQTITNSLDSMRGTAASNYAEFGKNIATAANAARLAKISGAGGALVDGLSLTKAIDDGIHSGDWDGLGSAAAGIGAAAVLGEAGIAFAVSLGLLGTPFVVAAFIFAGLGAYLGASIGDLIFSGWKQLADLIPDLFNAAQKWIERRDPLVLDLDGDGIETIPPLSTNPILFDHDGDGIKNGTGWIKSDDGFLVLDRNNNGFIDNGTELFGDSTNLISGGKAADGFAALADQDSNHDGQINVQDTNFNQLKVWRDLNQDGISQAEELSTLAQTNIASISLTKTANNQVLPNGNEIADLGTYTKTDGSIATLGEVSRMAEVNLFDDTFHREFPDHIPLATGVEILPDMQGSGKVRDLREAASQSTRLKYLLAYDFINTKIAA